MYYCHGRVQATPVYSSAAKQHDLKHLVHVVGVFNRWSCITGTVCSPLGRSMASIGCVFDDVTLFYSLAVETIPLCSEAESLTLQRRHFDECV